MKEKSKIPQSSNAMSSSDRPSSTLELWDGSASVVNQGRHWSSSLIWIGSFLFGSTLIWAFTSQLDQTVTVQGRLVPSGRVREVESPSTGRISEVFVSEGQTVEVGQKLFTVESQGLSSRKAALIQTEQLLDVQAAGLKTIISSNGNVKLLPPLPPLPPTSDPKLRAQLFTSQQQADQLRSQLIQISSRLESREKTLELKQAIAEDIKPLFEMGAMARNQYLSQLNQIQEMRADVLTLKEEQSKLIGQVASQLNQIDRQLLNIRAEQDSLNEQISYHTVQAPVAGKVFDRAIKAFDVVNTNESVLKLIPAKRLEASVYISDSDIGFVKVGMPANVSVASFPSGEFGFISGKVESLGLDSLPPSQETPTYSFPATISLEQQTVQSGDTILNLQSGMAVAANIKLRSRPVISIVTDLFTRQLEGVKRFR